MGQMEAVCSRCGEDYAESGPEFRSSIFGQYSLLMIFRLVTLMGIVFAMTPWLLSLRDSPAFPVVLALVCAACAKLLENSAPICSRTFGLAGIVSIVIYPVAIIAASLFSAAVLLIQFFG